MTRIEEPFVMWKSMEGLTGNDRFEGFCVDLLEQISDQVGFKYIIELGKLLHLKYAVSVHSHLSLSLVSV